MENLQSIFKKMKSNFRVNIKNNCISGLTLNEEIKNKNIYNRVN